MGHRQSTAYRAILRALLLIGLLAGGPCAAYPRPARLPSATRSALPRDSQSATRAPNGEYTASENQATSESRATSEHRATSENPATVESRAESRAAGATASPPHPRRTPRQPLDTVTAHRSPTVARDSLDFAPSERNRRLYDSIRTKAHRRALPRMLYRILFRPSPDDSLATADHPGRALDESLPLRRFDGCTVGSVRIERAPVFRPNGNWFERTGNRLHAMTRERVIRRDLLLRPGNRFDPQLVVRNKRLLRSRVYLADADIEVRRDPFDSTRVDLVVRTRDSWTIALDGASRHDGRAMLGLYDANLLGSGNLLRIETNFDRHDLSYGGNRFAYEIPNLLGTFFTSTLSAGRDFHDSEFRASLYREFLRPTDYMLGLAYDNIASRRRIAGLDTRPATRSRRLDLWGGYSRYLPAARSSLFLTGRYRRTRFVLRPAVDAGLHPAFHDGDLWLLSAGLYRERFYTANMVHGFGTREYLATGFRAQLTGGYSRGEFADEAYLGLGLSAGGFLPRGYFMASLSLGSFIDPRSGAWRRSAVDIDLRWFSNLYAVRRSRLRQFLSVDYTQGWNRLAGAGEAIEFTRPDGLHLLDERRPGTTRAVLNTETVLFTPYQPLGFRIALFGFADFGTIGFSPNLFRNDFFTAFGIGVRLRNERLVFSTLQIRLGIALGKGGAAGCDYFRIGSSDPLDDIAYRPARPETVRFE